MIYNDSRLYQEEDKMEGKKMIVRPLGKSEEEVCCECKKSATHEVDSQIKGRKVFTCNLKPCMGPHLWGCK